MSLVNSFKKTMVKSLSHDVEKLINDLPEDQYEDFTHRKTLSRTMKSLSRGTSLDNLNTINLEPVNRAVSAPLVETPSSPAPHIRATSDSSTSRASSVKLSRANSIDFDPRNNGDLELLKQSLPNNRRASISTLERYNEERDDLYNQLIEISPKRFGDLDVVSSQVEAVKRWIIELDRDIDDHLTFNEATGGMKMVNKLRGYKKQAQKYLALAGEDVPKH